MLYIFNDFKFDSESLLLTKNGEPLDIRHNEIRVLALLLEHSGKVLSKECILSDIWKDKAVSEQAVFQNISHLRTIFGDASIRTFPKRGYQWQLKTEIISSCKAEAKQSPHPAVTQYNKGGNAVELAEAKQSPHPAVTLPQPSDQLTQPAHPDKRPVWLYTVLAGVVFILMTVIYGPVETSRQSNGSAIKLAYIPFSTLQKNTNLRNVEVIPLEDNAHFNFTVLPHLDSEQFQTSAELEYPLLAETHPFVLTAEIRSHNQQFHLDFLLKGPFADWQGQLSAGSDKEVIKRLLTHLQQPFIYDLLSQPLSPELKQAKLSIAHQRAPEDLIILGSLINIYSEMGELEKAMVMADKLANSALSQNNPQQTGNALLYQSKILTRKKLFDLSSQKLNLAIAHFKQIDDLKRQADAWHSQSWLDLQNDNYPAVKSSLLKAAQLAYQASDKPRELDALTYLSVLAHKNQQTEDKYSYLLQAENKMKAYQLPIYHFGKVPFHYAIFAKNAADKEPHLKQVLEFTALTPDVWFAQSSRNQLMSHYLKHHRLNEAQALVDSVTTENASNSYLKALLAQAKQQPELMIVHAKRAFEQAQLAGYRTLSLDVALLLCNTPNVQINRDFYSQYIHQNATEYWRQSNEAQLIALNL